MLRAWLQAGQAKLVQPSADGVLMHLHLEPAGHLGLQVHASPTHHAMQLWIRALDHQVEQLRPLQLAQGRRPARGRAVSGQRRIRAGRALSGGPVVNARGEVIGVATPFIREGENLGFAVPLERIVTLEQGSPRTFAQWRHPRRRPSPGDLYLDGLAMQRTGDCAAGLGYFRRALDAAGFNDAVVAP